MTEIINFLKKYTDGKQNTEKVEISVLQLNRVIKALEQDPILEIRAEIEKWHKEGTNWSDIRLMKIEDILDKHKTESED